MGICTAGIGLVVFYLYGICHHSEKGFGKTWWIYAAQLCHGLFGHYPSGRHLCSLLVQNAISYPLPRRGLEHALLSQFLCFGGLAQLGTEYNDGGTADYGWDNEILFPENEFRDLNSIIWVQGWIYYILISIKKRIIMRWSLEYTYYKSRWFQKCCSKILICFPKINN